MAIRKAVQASHSDDMPPHLSVHHYRSLARVYGPMIYLAHPADVSRIFAGVTLNVYRTIERLYCSRSGRTIFMVWRIIARMADRAAKPPIDYEAVWAICQHLDDARAQAVATTIDRTNTTWHATVVIPDVTFRAKDGIIHRSLIACVVDTADDLEKVLGLMVVEEGASADALTHALYDALISQRRPSASAAAGLCWRLPERIVLASKPFQASSDMRETLVALGIEVVEANALTSPLLETLRGDWMRDLGGRILTQGQIGALINTYLHRIHRHGPRHIQREADRTFTHYIGYNRDPAWQFPALRRLLPDCAGVIEDDFVAYNGLHYTHDLLIYWAGRDVTLRPSRHAEVSVWIYLDGEILCRATARELQRADGSYRLQRARR